MFIVIQVINLPFGNFNFFNASVYYFFFNLGIFLTIILIFGFALYYSYINKPNDYEKYQKNLKDQEYILSKIRFHQQIHHENQAKMSNITNLPVVI